MEGILPKAEETIAAKRSVRIRHRLTAAGHSVFSQNNWWGHWLVEFWAVALILGLNLWVVSPLIGLIIPSTPFSGPLIPLLAGIINKITGVPFYSGVQIVEIAFFLCFSIFFYFLIKSITGRRLIALVSVLIATIPGFIFARTRVIGGLLNGDGPHMASLGIIPLAIFALIKFLRHGGLIYLIVAAILSSSIILISPFGFAAYIVFSVSTAFSEMLLGKGRLKLLRFAMVFLLAALLVSFWYNPVFVYWMITGPLGVGFRLAITHLIPLSLFGLPILGTFGFLLFDRKPTLQPVFMAIAWTVSFLTIMLAGGVNFLSLESSRMVGELGISVAFLGGIGLVWLIDRLKVTPIMGISYLSRPAFGNPLIALVLIVLVISILFPRPDVYAQGEGVKISTDIEKGQIWIVRDQFEGVSVAIGSIITGLSVLALTLFSIRITKNSLNR